MLNLTQPFGSARNVFQPFGFTKNSRSQKRNLVVFWVILLFLLWQYVPAGALFPRPAGTWNSMKNLYVNGMSIDAMVSLGTILKAMLIAFFVGAPLGYLYTVAFFRPFIIVIANLRNMMMNILPALFLMMQMTGAQVKIYTMSFVIMVYFVSSVVQIIDDVQEDEIDHAIAMRMSPIQILWHRIIRGKMYKVYMAFIPCVAMGWSMLSFVEGVARSQGGLGDLMLQNDKVSNYNGILALGIVSLTLGFILWYSLRALGEAMFKWAVSNVKKGR